MFLRRKNSKNITNISPLMWWWCGWLRMVKTGGRRHHVFLISLSSLSLSPYLQRAHSLVMYSLSSRSSLLLALCCFCICIHGHSQFYHAFLFGMRAKLLVLHFVLACCCTAGWGMGRDSLSLSLLYLFVDIHFLTLRENNSCTLFIPPAFTSLSL